MRACGRARPCIDAAPSCSARFPQPRDARRARANGGALRRRRIRASARPAVAAARAAAIHFAVQKALIVAVAAC
ncbi:hypothetical protein BURPSS13_L0110 [Burkholderia pseudomallei S13]|nr:hypothetical protein BURPSS13_L0110 [Burkholderia pseudomallei S13]